MTNVSVTPPPPIPGSRIVAGYLRKSHVEKKENGNGDKKITGIISEADQRAAITRLAAGRTVTEFIDWDRSGRESQRARRKEFIRLCDLIERDQVEAVYAYNWSRITRSLDDLIQFTKLCIAHGVTFKTEAEAWADTGTTHGRLMMHTIGGINEFLAELQRDQALARIAAQKAEGTYVSKAPFGFRNEIDPVTGVVTVVADGSAQTLLDVYAEKGSFIGTANALNAAGIPTSSGRGRWCGSMVRRTLVRLEHKDVPKLNPRGQRRKATAPLGGLFRCHCGRMLTHHPNAHSPYLICSAASIDKANHPKKAIAVSKVQKFLQRESGKYLPNAITTTAMGDAGKRRDELTERLRRVSKTYTNGGLSDTEYEAEVATINRELVTIEDGSRMLTSLTLPAPIDWANDDPEATGILLRKIWRHVEVGPDLVPTKVVWAIPAEFWDTKARDRATEKADAIAVAAS